MDFVLQTPSLQYIAGVQVVAHLWNRRISTLMRQKRNALPVKLLRQGSKGWEAMEATVNSHISALPLPETCKAQLLNFTEPLGKQISYWCTYHHGKRNCQLLENMLARRFCWTLHGALDYAKTAELMAKDERVDVDRRFEVACISCLEKEATELFAKVSNYRMKAYVNTLKVFMEYELFYWIVSFTRTLDVDRDRLNRFFPSSLIPFADESLFRRTLLTGNRALCEYLFTEMDQQEKDTVLKKCRTLFFNIIPSRNLLYYLSLMNDEQQRYMFHGECLADLLKCLLRWPLQSLFLETAKYGWRCMDENDYLKVAWAIVMRICFGYRDYDYYHLFQEFWRLSPPESKRSFLANARCLLDFLRIEREEFLLLILNDLPRRQLKTLYNELREVLIVGCDIAEAVLVECPAATNNRKRLKREQLRQLVAIARASKIKRIDFRALFHNDA